MSKREHRNVNNENNRSKRREKKKSTVPRTYFEALTTMGFWLVELSRMEPLVVLVDGVATWTMTELRVSCTPADSVNTCESVTVDVMVG